MDKVEEINPNTRSQFHAFSHEIRWAKIDDYFVSVACIQMSIYRFDLDIFYVYFKNLIR